MVPFNSYNKDRQLIPWGEQQPERRGAVEKYNQNKPIGRVFNPVLMKFTDADAEARRSDQVAAASTSACHYSWHPEAACSDRLGSYAKSRKRDLTSRRA